MAYPDIRRKKLANPFGALKSYEEIKVKSLNLNKVLHFINTIPAIII